MKLDGKDNSTLELTASHKDRDGERHETVETISFAERERDYFENDATRKAVALSRYATLMQNWIDYERETLAGDEPVAPEDGDGLEETAAADLGRWERQSTDLQVSSPYGERIHAFSTYFAGEITAVDDETVERELELMATLLEASDLEDAFVPAVESVENGGDGAKNGDGNENGTDSSAVVGSVGT